MKRLILLSSCLALLCSPLSSLAGAGEREPSSGKDGAKKGASEKSRKASTRSTGKAPGKSSEPQRGKASFYSHRFAGKRMADGTRMDLESNAAASKTLPLGSKARVENLNNGKTAEVEIRDRGPHVKGRIIDLSPATAKALGVGRQGIIPVEVTPIGKRGGEEGRREDEGGESAAPGSAESRAD